MGIFARIGGGRRGRWAWLVIALVVGGLAGGTFVAASRAVDRAREDAIALAKRYAETVLFENLDPSLPQDQIIGPLYRQGTILGPKYRALLTAVQDTILIDPNVTRVRIWDRQGLLIFSTTEGDKIGQTGTANPKALATALDGGTTSAVSGSGAASLLDTVTPLRVPGHTDVVAVAGIQQDESRIAADATAPWTRARLGLVALLVLSLGFVVVALANPEPPRRVRGAGEAGRLRAELDYARRQLGEATRDRGRATAELERVTAERDALRADATTGRGAFEAQPPPEPSAELAELRSTAATALVEAERAETRAARAEAAVAVERERARVAEERVQELERVVPTMDLGAPRTGGDAPSEEQLRAYELTLRTAAVRQLRGPVSRIRGVTLSLKNEVETTNGRDLVQRLSTASDKLDRLVADLDSLSRLVDGSLPLQRWNTDLDRFVDRVVSEWRQETGQSVLVETMPVSVPVDQNRLRQVIEGLLDDASTRADEQSTLKVKVRTHEEGAVISVEEPSEAGSASTARIDLHLAIARRLVELHGGRMWSERRRDGTAAILVLFPSDVRTEESGRVPPGFGGGGSPGGS